MSSLADMDLPRLLIIDDNVAIHQDFVKIFGTTPEKAAEDAFLAAEAALFGESVDPAFARPGSRLTLRSRDRKASKRRGGRCQWAVHMVWRSSI